MQHPRVRLGLTSFLMALGGALSTLPGSPALAGATVLEEPEQASQPDRRRLLRLADGSVLRARSRAVGEAWEVRVGRNWEPIEGRVVSHRLEREMTAEARQRLSSAGRDDLEGTLAAAVWMLDEGLQAEGIEALQLILAREREHAGALALIATRHIELELDDAGEPGSVERLRALLSAGARGPAAESEVALQRIAEFGGRTDIPRLIEIELAHPNYHHRVFAVLMARRLCPGSLLEDLVDRALLDRYEVVRGPAAQALGSSGEVAVLAPMIRALASEHSVLRLHAVEAMGAMGYPAAVEPLMVHLNFLQSSAPAPVGARANLYIGTQTAIVGDYDVEIAQGASIADPVVGVVESGVLLDVRAVAHITRVIEQRAVMSALGALTDERGAWEAGAAPTSVDEWVSWWEREKPAWRALDLATGD